MGQFLFMSSLKHDPSLRALEAASKAKAVPGHAQRLTARKSNSDLTALFPQERIILLKLESGQ